MGHDNLRMGHCAHSGKRSHRSHIQHLGKRQNALGRVPYGLASHGCCFVDIQHHCDHRAGIPIYLVRVLAILRPDRSTNYSVHRLSIALCNFTKRSFDIERADCNGSSFTFCLCRAAVLARLRRRSLATEQTTARPACQELDFRSFLDHQLAHR